jgi:hypothetical protein
MASWLTACTPRTITKADHNGADANSWCLGDKHVAREGGEQDQGAEPNPSSARPAQRPGRQPICHGCRRDGHTLNESSARRSRIISGVIFPIGTRPRYGPMCLARRLCCAPPLARHQRRASASGGPAWHLPGHAGTHVTFDQLGSPAALPVPSVLSSAWMPVSGWQARVVAAGRDGAASQASHGGRGEAAQSDCRSG